MVIINEQLEQGMRNMVWKYNNHANKFRMKRCLHVNNYKHGDVAKLRSYAQQF
jgi:hypothetical protein